MPIDNTAGTIRAAYPRDDEKSAEATAPTAKESTVETLQKLMRFTYRFSEFDRFPKNRLARSVPRSVLIPVKCVVLICPFVIF